MAMSKSGALAKRILSPATAILLFLQAALVVTGGAVRLTGSGLGCPTWPECTPGSYIPVAGQVEGQLHAWIEFGNRLLTFILVLAALVTLVAVLRSGRKDLRILAVGQFLGIFGQGVLGGITVLTNLNPISVASHYLLSTILIAAATSLFTRRHRPAVKKISPLQPDVFSRLHITLSALVIILGTIVTGAGPHAGDIDAPRLHIRIQSAALLHGIAVAVLIALTLAFFLAQQTSEQTRKLLAIFALLTIAQGAIGLIQYIQGVPELLVASHLAGSTLVWIAAWKIWLSVQREEMELSK
jgi:cytochrome c oxidase assembly protein subunit 15